MAPAVVGFLLTELTTAERARVEARQQHIEVREELLNRL
jgi:hypothetical protein